MHNYDAYYCHACRHQTCLDNGVCSFCGSEFIEIYDSNEYHRSIHLGITEILRNMSIEQMGHGELDNMIDNISGRIRQLTQNMIGIRMSEHAYNNRNATNRRASRNHYTRRNTSSRRRAADDIGSYVDFLAYEDWYDLDSEEDHYFGSPPIVDDIDNYVFENELDDIIEEMFISAKAARNPASKKFIKRLRTSPAINDGKCTICLDEYNKGDLGIMLECRHFFHKNCCVKWMKIQNTCPICREQIEKVES